MRKCLIGLLPILVALASSSCDQTRRADAANVVDSVIPREEALRRFRAGLAPADSLTGSAPSREALVRGFVRALESRDTAALHAMVLSKAEFAWLYYPTNPQGLPPYDLSPALFWFTLEGRSAQGLSQAMAERGGHMLRYAGTTCDGSAAVEGVNRIHAACMVRRLQAPGDTVSERLFGPIIERDGRFKFVSYANKL